MYRADWIIKPSWPPGSVILFIILYVTLAKMHFSHCLSFFTFCSNPCKDSTRDFVCFYVGMPSLETDYSRVPWRMSNFSHSIFCRIIKNLSDTSSQILPDLRSLNNFFTIFNGCKLCQCPIVFNISTQVK